MDKKNPLSELIQECMAKAREMADTNTIVGQPISTPDGVTLIPISRVSVGFGGGGAVFGIGSGVKIDPVAFLIVKDGFVRVMPVAAPAVTTVDRIVEMVPDLVDKVRDLIGKKPAEEEVVDPETL